ncbi:MAG: ribosomal-processing cysteine protease Prp [Clostridia bacterium]|nr:ribosomal-processing cysteine protease Prp [Clostridia bacterium]
MVHVHIIRDSERLIREYTVEGHADAGRKGHDIVCASVSAIAYTGVNALEEIAGIRDCYVERDGYMKCVLPLDIPEDIKITVKIIMETVAVGFKQIQYTPEYRRFISILDEEV